MDDRWWANAGIPATAWEALDVNAFARYEALHLGRLFQPRYMMWRTLGRRLAYVEASDLPPAGV
ncbi:hypothetical protein LCGC14_0393890 [marine sediment metagenome]|uniref:Uncharacterized protein n=1 Tax=marine sediment metagenome TaxID=412755 RepID=A0A0F9T4D9_9ZZZZ